MIAATTEEIEALRTGGKILADALRMLAGMTKPGVTTAELDLAAEDYIHEHGGEPAFLGYHPEGATSPYPAVLCVSINDEVVHGIPGENRIIESGDIVSLDLGLSYNGLFVDSALTVVLSDDDAKANKLIAATRDATYAGIAAAVVGAKIGDIGAAVEAVGHKNGFAIVEDLGGHAVGRAVHERPFIPNEGPGGIGETIVEGMVLAIEPMLSEGRGAIALARDGWTYYMRDHSRAAHFEHTILVTKNRPEILTK